MPVPTALIMAGGQGSRMRNSGMARPKPLVEVAGLSLIEHNLYQLARHGYARIIVVVAEDAITIRDFIAQRLCPLGERLGLEVSTLVETLPLGNIGAAGLLQEQLEDLLVVFADNLTGLDLRSIYTQHQNTAAALTLAAHQEPFRMPYGELRAASDDPERLASYIEKPVFSVLVSSAISVLSAKALKAIPKARSYGLSELAEQLLRRGELVRLYRHNAAWIDVNDFRSIAKAEQLIAAHPGSFVSAPATGST